MDSFGTEALRQAFDNKTGHSEFLPVLYATGRQVSPDI
jgi:hypothetical protein